MRFLAALLIALLACVAPAHAVKLYNLCSMSTATAGTGTITLGSASASYLAFADCGVDDGDTVTYAIVDGVNREIGRGVYTTAGTTLTRATVLESTNGGSAITLSGTATVFVAMSAEDAVTQSTTSITVTAGAADSGGASAAITDGDKGDITVGTSGTDFQIDASAVGPTEIATDGVSADELNATGVETELEAELDLPQLQGILTVAKGGTGSAPAAADQVLVSTSTSAATWQTLCDSDAATSKLQYDVTTDAFSCGTDDDVPEVGDFGALVGGNGIDNNSGTLDLDLLELTTDNTPVQTADFVPYVDVAGGNTTDKLLMNVIGTGKKTISVQAGAMMPNVTSGCALTSTETGTNDVMYRSCNFSAAADQFAQFSFSAPKGSDETIDLTARISWTGTTATDATDDVIWGMACTAFSEGDALDGTAWSAADVVTDTVTTASDLHHSPEITAITPAGSWTEGDDIWCRVTRDADAAGDTYNGTADLIGVRLLITTNSNVDD